MSKNKAKSTPKMKVARKFADPQFKLDRDKSLIDLCGLTVPDIKSTTCHQCHTTLKARKKKKKIISPTTLERTLTPKVLKKKSPNAPINCKICGHRVCQRCCYECHFPEIFKFEGKQAVCSSCFPGFLVLRQFPSIKYAEIERTLRLYMRKYTLANHAIASNDDDEEGDLTKIPKCGFLKTETQMPTLTIKTKLIDHAAKGLFYLSGMRDGGKLDRELIINRLSKRNIKYIDEAESTDMYIKVPYRYPITEDYKFDKYGINPEEVLPPPLDDPTQTYDLHFKVYQSKPKDPNNLQPVLIWMHGGGFVIGDVADSISHRMVSKLTNLIHGIVINVNYRLAPEFKWPTQPEDCYSVLDWIYKHGEERFGADVNRIIVGGDSAGGNLSLVLSIMAKERNGPRILHQLAVYPNVDAENTDAESMKRFEKGPILRLSLLRWFKAQYLHAPDSNVSAHPYLSPAVYDSPLGLPPLTMITAGFCPLTDPAKIYAEKLYKAGVPTTYTEYTKSYHGFFNDFSFDSVSAVLEACVFYLIECRLAHEILHGQPSSVNNVFGNDNDHDDNNNKNNSDHSEHDKNESSEEEEEEEDEDEDEDEEDSASE